MRVSLRIGLAITLVSGLLGAGTHAAAADAANPVVSVAGDIACGTTIAGYNNGNGTATACRQKYTAALLAGSDAVFTLGDHVYPVATTTQFQAAYTPTWGQYKSITYPTPGDHDYGKINGRDYFAYFGRPAYYSFDIGAWHVVSLNSEIDHTATSAQVAWLQQDLAATRSSCIAATWGEARWTSGKKGGNVAFDPFIQTLRNAHADLVLVGDTHNYERFAKMAPDGTADPEGLREFVVGTGGRSLDGFPNPQPTSEKKVKAFGVLKLTLHDGSYDWQFVDQTTAVRDAGSATCNP
jgi:hypothetical protein